MNVRSQHTFLFRFCTELYITVFEQFENLKQDGIRGKSYTIKAYTICKIKGNIFSNVLNTDFGEE